MACILLVEDEAEIRLMLAEVLADAGHAVVEADSGDAAALLLQNREDFDALVTDITMPGRLDGIVTNWGNPLVGFNDLMKQHTDIAFYTSVFFVVMNKDRFASLPADIQAAVEELSNEALVNRFGLLWNKWDKPVRDGASAPGHEVLTPDGPALEQWRAALQPVTDRYLDGLAAAGFTDARAAHAKLLDMIGRALPR